MVYNVICSDGFLLMFLLFFMFSFLFLRMISEGAGERGLMFSGLTMKISELRH